MATSHTSKPARIFAGYGVDGSLNYISVTIDHDKIICPECEGTGRMEFDCGVDGFSKPYTDTCEACDGDGELSIEVEETNE